MTKDVQLSVVMPVHNAQPYLAEAVDSILAQSHSDFSFVIGDDGSDDGSLEMLRDYARRDRRIRLLTRAKKSGPSNSARWVVAESRTPYVARMDADDVAHPERLERQLAVLRARSETSMVGALWIGIDASGAVVRPADYWRLLSRAGFAPFPHSGIMFRRACYDAAGGYRGLAEYWEDLDLYYRLNDLGPIEVVPAALMKIRHTGISTRLRNNRDDVERQIDLMYRVVERYRDGQSYEDLLTNDATPARLNPRTYVSSNSVQLWSGQPIDAFRRMLGSARMGLDLNTVVSLAWAAVAAASPAFARWLISAVINVRSAIARVWIGRRASVRWRPRRSD